jgi:hypothetical protein
MEGVYPRFAIASQHDRPNVAGPHPILAHQFHHAVHQLVTGKLYVDAVNLGRIEQTLNMILWVSAVRAKIPREEASS